MKIGDYLDQKDSFLKSCDIMDRERLVDYIRDRFSILVDKFRGEVYVQHGLRLKIKYELEVKEREQG